MASQISELRGREVIDSRGNPTLEVEMTLSDGSMGRAIVPSGASRGEREALELRDEDSPRFLGKGVLNAVKNVEGKVATALVGKTVSSPAEVDHWLLELDNTPQKDILGGNTLLGVSLAAAQAFAISEKRPLYQCFRSWMGVSESAMSLPVPLMNIINGGQHADNGLEIQEFMIVPHGFETFSEALRAGCEVFQHLKKRLHSQKMSTSVGDEGGFAPHLKTNSDALDVICDAIQKAGYQPGKQVALALDCAASSFYDKASKGYLVGGKTVNSADWMKTMKGWIESYPIVSVEDGLDENDWDGWREFTSMVGSKVQLVGDDLFVTQPPFVKKGISEKSANAVLVKVNQVGTLAETFQVLRLCRENGWSAVVSHRSGETEDTTIAHLAVGSGCGQIKTGSLSRGERTAKYNELLRIEERAKREGKPISYSRRFTV